MSLVLRCFLSISSLKGVQLSHLDQFLTKISSEPIKNCGIRKIDQIYVLNLDVRSYRWLRTKALLEEANVFPQRFFGINGWSMPRQSIKKIYKDYVENGLHSWLTPGQIGCFLSHIAILQDAMDRRYKCIWVLEDDIIILKDPKEIESLLIKLDQIDSEWDLLFTDVQARGNSLNEPLLLEHIFSSFCEAIKLQDHFFIPYEDDDFLRIQYRLCTHSMIISHRGIKKLLDYFQSIKISFPIDVQMHCCPGKRFYVSKKEYVTNGKRETSDTTYRPH